MNRSSNQQINKDMTKMSHATEQMDVTDIYKTFHPTVAEYVSITNETFSRKDHVLVNRLSLRNFFFN